MSERSKGSVAMVLACLIWGLAPIFYKLLVVVPPLEVLSHRTLWSLVFFAGVLVLSGRLGELKTVLSSIRGVALAALAGLFISLNWFGFIYSVQFGRVIEASLGYFIFPLVSVALGYLVFGERLSRAQWLAVGLAALAVVLLTYGLGSAPWISLWLATSFGLYGVLKKKLTVGPVVSVTAEVFVLLPVALVWLFGVHLLGWQGVTARPGGYFGRDLSISLLLMAAGPLTATPLILYSYATKRLSMAATGLLQYLNPTLQFLVATLVFKETFSIWHSIAFGLIWTALVVFSGASLFRKNQPAAPLSVPPRPVPRA